MSTRPAYHPLEQSKRLFDSVADTGLGICALSNLIGIADPERYDDATLRGVGVLLDRIGSTLLDTAHHGCELIDKHPG